MISLELRHIERHPGDCEGGWPSCRVDTGIWITEGNTGRVGVSKATRRVCMTRKSDYYAYQEVQGSGTLRRRFASSAAENVILYNGCTFYLVSSAHHLGLRGYFLSR